MGIDISDIMAKANLLLTDLIEKTGINPKDIKLIRHAQSDETFKMCKDMNMVKEYTSIQKTGFSKDRKYWMVFIGAEEGTTAMLDSFYKVKGSKPFSIEDVPKEYPESVNPKICSFFELEKLNCLDYFENRLIIEWGKSRGWHHNADTSEKVIKAIQKDKKIPFSSYDEVILPYPKLKEIIEDPNTYSDWHAALSNVNGIYVIVEPESGKQYIGSAYGEKGILHRWKEYVKTKHGGNKKLKEIINEKPDIYKSFQFSILQVLPSNISDKEVISIETNFKNKLLTKDCGLNDN